MIFQMKLQALSFIADLIVLSNITFDEIKTIYLKISYKPGISLRFGVAGRHCHEPGQIHCFIVYPMDQFINVAGTEGKVGGYFCQLPPLNENTVSQATKIFQYCTCPAG